VVGADAIAGGGVVATGAGGTTGVVTDAVGVFTVAGGGVVATGAGGTTGVVTDAVGGFAKGVGAGVEGTGGGSGVPEVLLGSGTVARSDAAVAAATGTGGGSALPDVLLGNGTVGAPGSMGVAGTIPVCRLLARGTVVAMEGGVNALVGDLGLT